MTNSRCGGLKKWHPCARSAQPHNITPFYQKWPKNPILTICRGKVGQNAKMALLDGTRPSEITLFDPFYDPFLVSK